MFKKILAAERILALVTAAVLAVLMSGCSKHTMTEEDLALQASLIGYWAADYTTDYNEFDDDGNLIMMTAIQFTDDFHYILYYYYPSQAIDEPSRFISSPAVSYSIEEGKFRVENEGRASYAGIGISEDGNIMSWITDEGTDRYVRISDQDVEDLGFPAYDPNKITETGTDMNVNIDGYDEEGGSDNGGSEEGSEVTTSEETGSEE